MVTSMLVFFGNNKKRLTKYNFLASIKNIANKKAISENKAENQAGGWELVKESAPCLLYFAIPQQEIG